MILATGGEQLEELKRRLDETSEGGRHNLWSIIYMFVWNSSQITFSTVTDINQAFNEYRLLSKANLRADRLELLSVGKDVNGVSVGQFVDGHGVVDIVSCVLIHIHTQVNSIVIIISVCLHLMAIPYRLRSNMKLNSLCPNHTAGNCCAA